MSNGERPLLNPGDVLNAISGLKREKLMYWVLKGYIRTHRETRGKRDYVFFYKEDLPKISEVYRRIVIGGMKDKEAFAKSSSGQLSF